MIASLEGTVSEIFPDGLTISLGGVGLRVFVSSETRQKHTVHDRIGLYTVLIVREDALTLFGFESIIDRDMFNLLLTVSGVGPRTAMTVVSTVPVLTIKKAILHQAPELLEGVTGIGKKTAQNIVINLQGKIKDDSGLVEMTRSEANKDVIAALTNLGYSIVEAQTAIQWLPKETPEDLELRLKAALRYFS